jgi:hypothetical protein
LSLILFALLALSWRPAGLQAGEPLVTFYAMGDVPYVAAEDDLLPKQVAELPADAEFVIHVGDIKDGSTPCNEAVYQKVAGMLRKSKARVFVIPGDNEWNDCVNPTSAWAFWHKHLFQFDRHWKNGQAVQRQAALPENFAFLRNGVLFVGINLVGGRVHDAEEWKKRHALDASWAMAQMKRHGPDVKAMVLFGHASPALSHSDFFARFVPAAAEFTKPILYLHGDGHIWIKDRPFEAKNILRVQVDRGGIASPVQVRVTEGEEPFLFDRRKE